MRVLPVLDVLNGHVVRGIAGRREEYRPIQSILTNSTEPLAVADAVRKHFGLTEFYLADLDSILGEPPAAALYEELRAAGCRLWVDSGIRQFRDAAPVAATGVEVVVAGLETLVGPDVLRQLCAEYGSERVAFSLDLREGQPLGDYTAWRSASAEEIAAEAVDAGVRRIILLDLARVGTGLGTGTESILTRLTRRYLGVDWIVGGGVREAADLRRLKEAGAAAVLIASALHDGRLRREDLNV